MGELVVLFGGRPAFVKHEGWTVSVSTMDAAYKDRWRAYKRLLRDAHPDRGGRATQFRKLVGQRERWLEEEEKRYQELGLEPPFGKQAKRKQRLGQKELGK